MRWRSVLLLIASVAFGVAGTIAAATAGLAILAGALATPYWYIYVAELLTGLAMLVVSVGLLRMARWAWYMGLALAAGSAAVNLAVGSYPAAVFDVIMIALLIPLAGMFLGKPVTPAKEQYPKPSELFQPAMPPTPQPPPGTTAGTISVRKRRRFVTRVR